MKSSKVSPLIAIVVMATALAWLGYEKWTAKQLMQAEVKRLDRALAESARRLDAMKSDTSLTRTLALSARAELLSELDGRDEREDELSPDRTGEQAPPPEQGVAQELPEERLVTAPGSAPLQMVVANIEAQFDSEETDTSSVQSSQVVRDVAGPLLSAGSRIESVDCRATMCRLESTQESLDSYLAFVGEITHSDACRECFYTQAGDPEDEHPKLVMYMARSGHSLPRLE